MPELPILPPIADAPLSVVLLARDDADRLERVTSNWVTYLNGLGREFELILVEDGSRDGSGERVAEIARRHRHLLVIRHDYPKGEGAALAAGLAAARYPLVCYCRCDPRYQPSDLRRLLKEIDKVHIVSGYRAGRAPPSPVRTMGLVYRIFCTIVFSHAPAPSPGWLGWNRLFGRWLVRACFGVRSRDIACPYRLLRREILVRIPLQSGGSFAHVELLAKANFLGHLIAEEVPLGDRQHPVVAEELRHERLRDVFTDAMHVFSHAEFGPAHLEKPEPPPAAPSEQPPPVVPQPSPTP
jgi:glycosyltransferase involved in cell wall biosynthesis